MKSSVETLQKAYIIEMRHYANVGQSLATGDSRFNPDFFITQAADHETVISKSRDWVNSYYGLDEDYGEERDSDDSDDDDICPRWCKLGYLTIREMVLPDTLEIVDDKFGVFCETPGIREFCVRDYPTVLSVHGSKDTMIVELTAQLDALRRDRAATKIQRKWLELYYNPRHRICKARIHREWLLMSST